MSPVKSGNGLPFAPSIFFSYCPETFGSMSWTLCLSLWLFVTGPIRFQAAPKCVWSNTRHTLDRQMGSQGRKQSGRKKYCLYLGHLADFTSSPTKLVQYIPSWSSNRNTYGSIEEQQIITNVKCNQQSKQWLCN